MNWWVVMRAVWGNIWGSSWMNLCVGGRGLEGWVLVGEWVGIIGVVNMIGDEWKD